MARMVFGAWVTGSRHDGPRGGWRAIHARMPNGRTACNRDATRLYALSTWVAPNGQTMVDCRLCLRHIT